MTQEIIARGQVIRDGCIYFLSVPDDPEQPKTTMWRGWPLGRWAEPYWGKWLTISLEEMEKIEMHEVYNKNCRYFNPRSRHVFQRQTDFSYCNKKQECPTCETPGKDAHPKISSTGCPISCMDFKYEEK